MLTLLSDFCTPDMMRGDYRFSESVEFGVPDGNQSMLTEYVRRALPPVTPKVRTLRDAGLAIHPPEKRTYF